VPVRSAALFTGEFLSIDTSLRELSGYRGGSGGGDGDDDDDDDDDGATAAAFNPDTRQDRPWQMHSSCFILVLFFFSFFYALCRVFPANLVVRTSNELYLIMIFNYFAIREV